MVSTINFSVLNFLSVKFTKTWSIIYKTGPYKWNTNFSIMSTMIMFSYTWLHFLVAEWAIFDLSFFSIMIKLFAQCHSWLNSQGKRTNFFLLPLRVDFYLISFLLIIRLSSFDSWPLEYSVPGPGMVLILVLICQKFWAHISDFWLIKCFMQVQ